MKKRLLVVFGGLLGVSCFALLFYRASVAMERNTDAHWLPYLLDNIAPGIADTIYLPGHTFAAKIPFLWVVFKTLGYNHFTYSLTNVANGLFWLAACVGIIAYFYRRDRTIYGRVVLFVFLAGSSRAFFFYTGVTTLRSSEYGLAYLLLLLCARYLAQESRVGQVGTLICLATGGFVLILSDEFFWVGYVMPVLCLIALLIFRTDARARDRVFTTRAIVLAAIVSVSGALATVLLKIIGGLPNTPVIIGTNASFSVNTFDGLGTSIGYAVKGIVEYFGSDVWGQALSASVGLSCLSMLAGLAGLALAIQFLARRLAHADEWNTQNNLGLQKDFFLFLATSAFALTLLAFVTTSFSSDFASVRYLSAAPLMVGVFAALYLNWPHQGGFGRAAIAACAVLFLANTYRLSTELLTLAPNMAYYNSLSNIITDNRVKVGYAGYWNAYSTTSLTAADDLIIPVAGCVPWRYIGTQSMFSKLPEFLLVERSGMDKQFWDDCSDERLVQLYGPPRATYTLKNGNDTVEVRILR